MSRIWNHLTDWEKSPIWDGWIDLKREHAIRRHIKEYVRLVNLSDGLSLAQRRALKKELKKKDYCYFTRLVWEIQDPERNPDLVELSKDTFAKLASSGYIDLALGKLRLEIYQCQKCPKDGENIQVDFIDVMERLGEPALKHLEGTWNSPYNWKPRVEQKLIRAIGETGRKKALPFLCEIMLKRQESYIVQCAAETALEIKALSPKEKALAIISAYDYPSRGDTLSAFAKTVAQTECGVDTVLEVLRKTDSELKKAYMALLIGALLEEVTSEDKTKLVGALCENLGEGQLQSTKIEEAIISCGEEAAAPLMEIIGNGKGKQRERAASIFTQMFKHKRLGDQKVWAICNLLTHREEFSDSDIPRLLDLLWDKDVDLVITAAQELWELSPNGSDLKKVSIVARKRRADLLQAGGDGKKNVWLDCLPILQMLYVKWGERLAQRATQTAKQLPRPRGPSIPEGVKRVRRVQLKRVSM